MIAFDLGSNTLRCVVIDCTTKEVVFEDSYIVKTADGLVQSGLISNEAIQRIFEAIRKIDSKFSLQNQKIQAVATEAMRKATNSQFVIDSIKKQTGVTFEVISGEEEARLTLLAVKHRLQTLGISKNFVLVDIGGGSTEIIFANTKGYIAQSFPLGIVTLSQRFDNLQSIQKEIAVDNAGVVDFIKSQTFTPELFIATAGTPTTLAALKIGLDYESYESSKINGIVISKDDIQEQFLSLLAMSEEERKRAVGVGREDLITTGVLILQFLLNTLGFEACMVVDDGLREGVALSGCEE